MDWYYAPWYLSENGHFYINPAYYMGWKVPALLKKKTMFLPKIQSQCGQTLPKIVLSFTGTWWEAHPSLLLSLYQTIYRSSIEYEAQILNNVNRNIINRINSVKYFCSSVNHTTIYSLRGSLADSHMIELNLLISTKDVRICWSRERTDLSILVTFLFPVK